MKKRNVTVTIVLTLLLAFVATSCTKDGVFNPKKKISKVFSLTNNIRILKETWTWDSNKLTRIDYGTAGTNFATFEYNKNQISKVIESNGDYLEYTYDGSKINKITYFEATKVSGTYTFEHKGSKISRISIESYDDSATPFGVMKQNRNLLRFVFPEQLMTVIDATMEQQRANSPMKAIGQTADETSYMVMNFTWKGNNISEMVVEENGAGGQGGFTVDFTYDDKSNPYYGLLMGESVSYYTKNNMLSLTIRDVAGTSATVPGRTEFTYVYDGDFPTQVIMTTAGYNGISYYEYH